MASKKKAKRKVARKAKAKSKRKYVRKQPAQIATVIADNTLPVAAPKKTRRKRRKNKAKVAALVVGESRRTFFGNDVAEVMAGVKQSGVKVGSIVFKQSVVSDIGLPLEQSAVVNLA